MRGSGLREGALKHVRWAWAVASVALLADAVTLRAQQTNVAAQFLVQPMGARAVGHGEAAVADSSLGTEGIWWNPASMARMRKREIAVHHAQTFGSTMWDMLTVAVPSAKLGTIAASAFVQNLGDSEVTLDDPGSSVGLFTNRYYVLSAAYATPMGKRFSAGITAKHVMIRFVCGGCIDKSEDLVGSTNAIDVGTQYILPVAVPITIAAAVRNIGPALRAKDETQADPLPLVVQVGTQAQLPIDALKRSNTSLDVLGDVLWSNAYESPSIRVGADLSYKYTYSLRAGYKHLSNIDGAERGLTVGVGLKYNKLQLDLARRFDGSKGIGGDAQPPTYVSLRYVF